MRCFECEVLHPGSEFRTILSADGSSKAAAQACALWVKESGISGVYPDVKVNGVCWMHSSKAQCHSIRVYDL